MRREPLPACADASHPADELHGEPVLIAFEGPAGESNWSAPSSAHRTPRLFPLATLIFMLFALGMVILFLLAGLKAVGE